MKRRHALAACSVLTCLLVLTPSVCLAMMAIEIVSKDLSPGTGPGGPGERGWPGCRSGRTGVRDEGAAAV